MNDEQIVLSLLSFYKKEGIDLSQVLDDPIFHKLSTATKVEMIKRYAQEIHDGTGAGFTRRDLRSIRGEMLSHGILGALTGLAASGAAAMAFKGGRISPGAVMLGALGGGAGGMLLGGLDRAAVIPSRTRLRDKLLEVARSQSDDSAVHALALSQRTGTSGALARLIKEKALAPAVDNVATEAAKSHTEMVNMIAGRAKKD